MKLSLLMLLAIGLCAAPAFAHTAGESFFDLEPGSDQGRFELALRDLDDALALDRDGDGRITARELREAHAAIAAHVEAGITLATAAPCAPRVRGVTPGRRAGAGTAVLAIALGCPPGDHLSFTSRLFFPRDGLHRAFVTVARAGAAPETHVLRAEAPRIAVPLAGPTSALTVARGFVADGMLHIFQGLDHVLFLVVLLLPAVLRRDGDRFVPAPSLASALADVISVVTAFTLAHSITLALAALGAVRAAPAIIEPAIAASVVLAALNNLVPLFGRERWVVAFALGLLHGFGFSSVLAEIGLPRAHLLVALCGFNLGVELGQLILVALVVPLAYVARGTTGYRRLALFAGSGATAAIALVWLIERVARITIF